MSAHSRQRNEFSDAAATGLGAGESAPLGVESVGTVASTLLVTTGFVKFVSWLHEQTGDADKARGPRRRAPQGTPRGQRKSRPGEQP